MPRNNPFPQIPTGAIFRLTFTVKDNAQLYESVVDYMANGPGGVSLATQIAFLTQWRANCEAALQAVLSAEAAIVQYSVAEVFLGLLPTFVATVNVAGTVAGTALPGTVAALISKTSNLKGQHGRGRQYLMSVPLSFQSVADANNLTNAAVAIYVTLATAELAAIPVGGLTFAMAICTRPVAPNTIVPFAEPVNGMTVRQLLATVRRRREGRGQ